MDWGLLGYWIGEIVQEDIPVLTGKLRQPSLIKLKHFGAAAASSGGVEMYHIPGVTPEANAMSRRRSADARSSSHASLTAPPSASSPTTSSTARPIATSISSCSAVRTTRSSRSG